MDTCLIVKWSMKYILYSLPMPQEMQHVMYQSFDLMPLMLILMSINPSDIPRANYRVNCFQQALSDVWILRLWAASVKVCQIFLIIDLKAVS